MKLECVIVCKDYSDFLEHTLPENVQHLDHIVVVTHPSDEKTKALCNKYSVEYVATEDFHENGDPFNKGKAINIGIDHLKGDGWILHLDSDIVLCKDFRRMLMRAPLDPTCVYGADRVNIYGYDNWLKVKPFLNGHYADRWFIDPGFCHAHGIPEGAVKFGARIVHMQYGWVPIGYFQLWHSNVKARYNYIRGAASGTDVMFPVQWPRAKRHLLPEIVVYHLDSETQHQIGTNWKGRRSKHFGHHNHHHHHGYDPKGKK